MKHLITVLLILNLSQLATAQGKLDSIMSTVLGEKRKFKIVLPSNYKVASKEKYDVVYILDGESNLETFSNIQLFANRVGYTPGVILVGVININRNRDFTPTRLKIIPHSGGADKFIDFFKQELIPYIDNAYSTSGQNILYGHSYGGLFTTYTMLSDPTIFSSYVVADPSLWWDDNLVQKMASNRLQKFPKSQSTLYISGLEGAMADAGISKFDSVMKEKAPENLIYKITAYEKENHSSIQLKTIYDGLRLIYDGYLPPGKKIEFHPMNGIVLKDHPYEILNISDLPELRYSTDGTTPTSSSPKLQKLNSFSGPMKLTIKSFPRKAMYERTIVGNFVFEKPPVPVPKPKKFRPGGLSYSYYEGVWDSLPNFKGLKLIKEGIWDKQFTFNKLPSKTNFALLFEGLIEIKEEGYYGMVVASDDGTRLYLNDKLLINNDGTNNSQAPKTFLIPLKKGFYPLRLEYFQKSGNATVLLKYRVPGARSVNPIIDIPSEVLYNSRL